MNKEEDANSWFSRLKQFLQFEPHNKDELIQLLRDAQIRSLIDGESLAMIESVILFSQMKVRDVMLPKNQMICINQDANLADILQIVSKYGHSRYPVIANKKNEVIGIIHAKDLLRFTADAKIDFDLHEIIRQAPIVPESKRLEKMLSEFRSNRNHMAIVVDEYGAVAGFVTLEDIIEQIIGDIEDEFDIDEDAYIKSHGAMHFVIKAHTPIEDFNEQLSAEFSGEEYDTIGGIVMANFGYLPKGGEVITINDFEFKIINADARRIKLIECFDLRTEQSKQTDTGKGSNE